MARKSENTSRPIFHAPMLIDTKTSTTKRRKQLAHDAAAVGAEP